MSKFNQKINEMLVVLNAVKKGKKDKEDKKELPVDPVMGAMNDALGRFGMNVSDEKPEAEPEDNEDPIEGSIEDMEDLDLPRPADDGNGEDGDEGEEGADDQKDFDFLGVGGPADIEPTDTENFKDGEEAGIDAGAEGGENKVRFEYKNGALEISIGSETAVVSPEQLSTIQQFLSTITTDGGQEGESTEDSDDGDENPFGQKEENEEDEGEEDGDGEDEKFGEARFDDPNPPSKKCKCGGTMQYDKHNQQYKCPKCHAWERGKSSL